jgi:hypothetical protein
MSNTPKSRSAGDAEIAREVARIKQEHPYNGNYRDQMAALLGVMFFKFGERVGANRLAALLAENGRSPSTSTAQDEINKFWGKIREASAIKIDRPDVPKFLLDLYADMAGKVWKNSMDEAGAMFESHRQEVAEQLKSAQNDANLAKEQLVAARAAAEQVLRELQLARERIEVQGNQLAAETAYRRDAESRVGQLTEQLSHEQRVRAGESLRMQHALQELTVALDQATSEQRRLLAIGDDFKQQAARDRALRVKTEETHTRLSHEVERLQQQVTQLSGEKGVLEGRLAAQDQQLDRLTSEQAGQSKSGQVAVRMKKLRQGLRVRSR